jgi:CheY-like chemotaxis protein
MDMKRILAVDDNSVDNMINEILLRRAFPDYEIIIFSDPREAMEFIRQNRHNLPDLILLDINMPFVSGWDLVNELAGYENPGNVFMLTSSVSRDDEAHARKFPFIKDHFIKPLNAAMIESIKKCEVAGTE